MAVGTAKPTLVVKPLSVALRTVEAFPCRVKAALVEPTDVVLASDVMSVLAPEAAAPKLVRAPAAVDAPVPPLATLVWPVNSAELRSTVALLTTPEALVCTMPAPRELRVTVPLKLPVVAATPPLAVSRPLKVGLFTIAKVFVLKPPPAVPLTVPVRLPLPVKLSAVLPWAAVSAAAP